MLAVLLATPVAAQAVSSTLDISPTDESTLLEGLTVTAPADPNTVRRRVETYVSGVTVRPENWGIARWRDRICPLVVGLSKPQADVVAARVVQTALRARAPVAAGKCRPNLFVIVTSDPERLLRAWHGRNSALFGYDLPARVNRFLDTDRPIRVWYNASATSPDGPPLRATGATDRVRRNPRAKATLLEFNGVRTFDTVVVVVHAERVRNLTLFQLADYVAMVGLTELSLDADIGDAPTILGLFEPASADRPIPTGLSDWDVAFLKALYNTSQRYKGQRSSIIAQVLKAVPVAR
jgi:hypothetical protein